MVIAQLQGGVFAIPAVALALNVALYSIIGAVVFALARRFARSCEGRLHSAYRNLLS